MPVVDPDGDLEKLLFKANQELDAHYRYIDEAQGKLGPLNPYAPTLAKDSLLRSAAALRELARMALAHAAAMEKAAPGYEAALRAQQGRLAPPGAPAGELPIVTAGHQRFYFDARLQEFRDVKNPMRSFALKSDEGQALFSIYVNQEARRH